ncbi:MAG: EamA family transporter [Pirellulaceae bacterium]|nr:EamA family transporter [bacterium]MDG2469492.1 EamA family transporter [Pirellulaceae bacterium]
MQFQFLIWNILFSSFFILCVKWVQKRDGWDVVTVGCINYVAAAFCALPGYWYSEPSAASIHANWTGATMGGCYFVAFFFLIYAVRWVGASNTAAVSRLALVIPIAVGILYWGEQAGVFQLIGIGVAMASLFMVGMSAQQQERVAQVASPDLPRVGPLMKIMVLGCFFLICGVTRVAQQTCKMLSDGAVDYPSFLFFAFVVASIPSIVILVVRRQKLSCWEVVIGSVLGATNILQSHFILLSLDYYKSVVVFPITSAGGLVFTALAAVFLLHEKLNFASTMGVILAAISICLLQIS